MIECSEGFHDGSRFNCIYLVEASKITGVKLFFWTAQINMWWHTT